MLFSLAFVVDVGNQWTTYPLGIETPDDLESYPKGAAEDTMRFDEPIRPSFDAAARLLGSFPETVSCR